MNEVWLIKYLLVILCLEGCLPLLFIENGVCEKNLLMKV